METISAERVVACNTYNNLSKYSTMGHTARSMDEWGVVLRVRGYACMRVHIARCMKVSQRCSNHA